VNGEDFGEEEPCKPETKAQSAKDATKLKKGKQNKKKRKNTSKPKHAGLTSDASDTKNHQWRTRHLIYSMRYQHPYEVEHRPG
jgi:hypothetical protein